MTIIWPQQQDTNGTIEGPYEFEAILQQVLSGGGGVTGDVPVFIQDATPSHSGKFLWVQTNVGGTPGATTLYINE